MNEKLAYCNASALIEAVKFSKIWKLEVKDEAAG
jgi:hypothetical protein